MCSSDLISGAPGPKIRPSSAHILRRIFLSRIDLHQRPQTGFKFEWKLKSLHVVKLMPDKENEREIPILIPHYLLRSTTPRPDSPLHPQNACDLVFQKMPSDSPTAEKVRITISSLEMINHSRIWENFHRLASEKKITLKTKVPTDPVGRMRFRAISCINFLIVYPYLILHAIEIGRAHV